MGVVHLEYQTLDRNPWRTIYICQGILENDSAVSGDYDAREIVLAARKLAFQRLCMMYPRDANDAVFLSGYKEYPLRNSRQSISGNEWTRR